MHRIIINWLFFFLPLLTRELLEDTDYVSFIFVSSVPNTGPGSSYLLNEYRRKEGREGGGKICPPETIKHYRKTKNQRKMSTVWCPHLCRNKLTVFTVTMLVHKTEANDSASKKQTSSSSFTCLMER